MKNDTKFHFIPTGTAAGPAAMIAALVAAGHSNTQARRAVATALFEVNGQATPATLLVLGRTHHPKLGKVTVYRTLDLLLELGLVRKLHSDDDCHRYAPVQRVHGHHVICKQCQQAVEFDCCDIGNVIVAVEAQTGFRVADHWLEMFGLCPDCQRNAN